MKDKIIVILGPTASGKSDLAVELALKFNGEVVSADSRQVYKGLNIGSGKITKEEMKGIPHHLLDVADPKDKFNVVEFQKLAYEAIDDIISRGKLPIIAGGAAFYIESIVNGVTLPEVKENPELRKRLESLPLEQLQEELKKLSPERYEDIDTQNPVRLIRAIEIATALGGIPKIETNPKYVALQIGLSLPKEELTENISKRLDKRMYAGMVEETKNLHEEGLSYERMISLGLDYKYLALLLQNEITEEEFKEEMRNKSWQFAKRQMTWFKRDGRIKWFHPTEIDEIEYYIN